MARNAVRRTASGVSGAEDQSVEEADEQAQEEHLPEGIPMPGGSPGIPIQRITSGATPNAESRVTRPADMVKADVRSEKDEAAPVPKQYEVLNGGRVMWNHMPYQLKPGQVISDHTHDIAAFRRQGIRMQELPPETAAS